MFISFQMVYTDTLTFCIARTTRSTSSQRSDNITFWFSFGKFYKKTSNIYQCLKNIKHIFMTQNITEYSDNTTEMGHSPKVPPITNIRRTLGEH